MNDLDKDKDANEGGGTLGGAASLVITSADLDNSDYPIAVKAKVIASAGSQYEIKLGNTCVENTEFYDNESAIGPTTFAGCINCHGNGTASFTIDGSSYATISTVTKIAPPKSNDYYRFAHTPANLDRTPFGNGGEYSHSDGRKWNPDLATHFRVMELAYRVNQTFTCPSS